MAVEGISMPIIDMAKFPAEKEKLMAAVTGPGYFRVINHGIPETIMTNIKASVRSIFELPAEVKQRITDIIPASGYIPLNRFDPLYEGMGVYDGGSPVDVHTFCSLLSVSPRDGEILSAYASKTHGLIVDLASKVAEGFGIVGCSFQEWPCLLRMNRYNFTKETAGSTGAKVHTDNSFITVLFEDESNDGLEIMDSTGNFLAVDPVPGTFLVIIGDIGKVWSNARLHNAKHRVLSKKAEPRITVALFMLAPKDNKVEPRAELIDSEHPQLYQSFDYREYRELRTSSLSMTGEVLVNWALDEAAAAMAT